MNTEITIHPKLQHYGLTTSKLDEMIDWYGKVLGMTVNHRSKIPAIARITCQGPPFSAFAFISNDEMDHRLVLFEMPRLLPIPTSAITLVCSTWRLNATRWTIC